MTQYAFILIAFFFATNALRADLVLEQQFADTNRAYDVTTRIHGDKLRVDQRDAGLSVLVDLATRNSFTLLTNKTYLQRFGDEARWEVQEEKKITGGTNEMDAPPARAVDTGRAEAINGRPAEIYTWRGAHGLVETLWVDTDFPNYEAIRAELLKLDKFNDSGLHRNGQPPLSLLPGMVLKSESTARGHTITTTLLSVKIEPMDAALFDLPVDYVPYKPPNKQP